MPTIGPRRMFYRKEFRHLIAALQIHVSDLDEGAVHLFLTEKRDFINDVSEVSNFYPLVVRTIDCSQHTTACFFVL